MSLSSAGMNENVVLDPGSCSVGRVCVLLSNLNLFYLLELFYLFLTDELLVSVLLLEFAKKYFKDLSVEFGDLFSVALAELEGVVVHFL